MMWCITSERKETLKMSLNENRMKERKKSKFLESNVSTDGEMEVEGKLNKRTRVMGGLC